MGKRGPPSIELLPAGGPPAEVYWGASASSAKRSFNERSLNIHLPNVVAPHDHAQCFHVVILL
ncbi:hypothetical protein A6U85_23815 [Agrobacterium sp. 13-626]|nr:hypothetical protein CN09_12775 [Rhizobium rhizogenes]MQB33781.1 hypothetical protein [Rhizobium rhizogenes]OCI91404.1 hypothetical protein A6U85_23815 [Agrobacterium sp. 13-626]